MSHRFFPQNDNQFRYTYAAGKLTREEWAKEPKTAIFTLLAFTWPIVFVIVGMKLPESRFSRLVRWIELFLCVATLCWLVALTFFEELLYGAFVVVAATGSFACTALFLLSTAKTWVLERVEGKKKFYKTVERIVTGKNRIWVIIARCVGYAVAMILIIAFGYLAIFMALSPTVSDQPAVRAIVALLLVAWTGILVYFCRRLYVRRSVIDRVEGTTTFYKTVDPTVTGNKRIWATLFLVIGYAGPVTLTLWVIFNNTLSESDGGEPAS